MASDVGPRVLLAGIPGVKKRTVIRRLQEWGRGCDIAVVSPSRARDGGDDPEPAMAEEYLVSVAKERGLIPEGVHGPRAMVLALGLPKRLLRGCWLDGFRRLSIPQGPHETKGRHLIALGAHLTFFHHVTRDFIALVDEDALKEMLSAHVVVTLIDDLEDIHERLKLPGEMYSEEYYRYGGFGGMVQACRNLGQLAAWRAAEIAWADAIAAKWKIPHYLFAVKHPIDTLARLLLGDEPCAYMSHPISEPRRQLVAGNEDAYRKFCRRIEAVAASLRSHVVLFEPTAVDEFRFESFKIEPVDMPDTVTSGESPVYLPKVLERWPLPAGGTSVVVEPITEPAFNAVLPPGLFEDAELRDYRQLRVDLDRIRKTNRQMPSPDADSQIEQLRSRLREPQMLRIDNATHIVGGLVPTVIEQVTARDLQLVAQSSLLLVVRPLYAGNDSGGVQSEIEYFCKLVNDPECRHFVAIFTTEEDERAWRDRAGAGWVGGQLLRSRPGTYLSHEERERILEACRRGLASVTLQDLEATAEAMCVVCADEAQKRGGQWPGTPGGDEGPLKTTRAFAGATRREELKGQLQAELVPAYQRTLSESGLDEGTGYAIYWVEAWPETQDLAAAVAAATGSLGAKE